MRAADLLAPVDRLLDRVTMYRLVILYLGSLLTIAAVQSAAGLLAYSLLSLAATAGIAAVACVGVNALFARIFGAPANHDSALITGLILALIAGPVMDQTEIIALAWAATLAMASKYILAVHHLHLFNPAAIGLVITGLAAGHPGSWWVGTTSMTPFVIAGGLLLVRKIRRGDAVWFFLWTNLAITLGWSAWQGVPIAVAVPQAMLNSPAWFLAFVMLTEPIAMPSTRPMQVAYGALTGLLAVPQLHVGTFYPTPEEALAIANAFAWPFRSHRRLTLRLERAIVIGPGVVDFLYAPASRLAYRPGQYMEWTLDHPHPDSRGMRRHFTLASSPTERTVRIGVRFSPNGSTYKGAMRDHTWQATPILATGVAGDFVLPRDRRRKLAFVAGGIGVTPFRSMVKYLTDRGEQRDIVLLQAAHDVSGLIYQDVFQQAERAFAFRHIPIVADRTSAPARWRGLAGHIDASLIRRQIPDYRERLFYVSGSARMVQSVREALRELGLPDAQIRTDDFSGLSPVRRPDHAVPVHAPTG